MKVFALSSLLLLSSLFVTAQLCSTGCVTSASGNVVFASGYAWYQPNGTTCGKEWLSSHIHTAIYYADAVGTSAGGSVIVDQGTCNVVDIAC